MSQLIRVSLLGLSLTAFGCGAGTAEIGPAKETKQADQEDINKKMMDSMQKNNAGSGGRSNLEAPGGEQKAP